MTFSPRACLGNIARENADTEQRYAKGERAESTFFRLGAISTSFLRTRDFPFSRNFPRHGDTREACRKLDGK